MSAHATQQEYASRFFSYVRVSDPSECWEWQGGKDKFGYGMFNTRVEPGKKKVWIASRYAYTITKGDIPHGLHVLHRCDNPKCVNPNHLWLGTQRENMADMAKKGRRKIGSAPTCQKGHLRTEQSTRLDASGYPRCRICRNESEKARIRRRRS